jgi:ferredoxin
MGRQVIQSTSIYFSPTGATRKIVKSIAGGLALRPRDFDLTLPAAREKGVILERDELLIFAFPVYGGRLPKIAHQIFSKMPKARKPVTAVVVYGNQGFDDALLELYDLCVSKDYEVVAAAAFIGEHSYSNVLGKGRPDPADNQSAMCFGLSIRQTLLGDGVVREKDLMFKAQRPYKPYPKKLSFTPKTSLRRCIGCLVCVKNCPVGAFVNGQPKTINIDKCILCAACIKLCPEKAKSFDDDEFCDDIAALAASNLERKEPVMILPPKQKNFEVKKKLP